MHDYTGGPFLGCAAPIGIRTRVGRAQIACRQCLPCRIRIQGGIRLQCHLENQTALSGQFITLTYSEAPEIGSWRDFSTFMRRLRAHARRKGFLEPVRFLGCGEYGDTFGRFHYHGLIWNAPYLDTEEERTKLWPQGFSKVGTITKASIRYTCGYVTKFLDQGTQAIHSRSTQPALGANVIRSLGAQYSAQVTEPVKVPPTVLSLDGTTFPLNTSMQVAFMEGANPKAVSKDQYGTKKLERSAVAAHSEWAFKMKTRPLDQPIERQRWERANRASTERMINALKSTQ